MNWCERQAFFYTVDPHSVHSPQSIQQWEFNALCCQYPDFDDDAADLLQGYRHSIVSAVRMPQPLRGVVLTFSESPSRQRVSGHISGRTAGPRDPSDPAALDLRDLLAPLAYPE